MNLTDATNIANGDFSALPLTEMKLYTNPEWMDAAEYWVEDDDSANFTFMEAREIVHAKYVELSEARQDEWVGFENYWNAHNPFKGKAA